MLDISKVAEKGRKEKIIIIDKKEANRQRDVKKRIENFNKFNF